MKPINDPGSDIDERLLFPQKECARLLGITPRAFADWNIEPIVKRGNRVLYYWRDVFDERNRRLARGQLRGGY